MNRRLLALALVACNGSSPAGDAGLDATAQDAGTDAGGMDAAADAPDATPCMVDASGSQTIIDAIDLSVAANGVCILRQTGEVVCRGLSPQPNAFPTEAGVVRLVRVSAGYHFYACGLDDTGRLWCWGDNSTAQLGSPSVDAGGTQTPVLVQKGSSPLYIDDFATGFSAMCAIEHGTRAVYCWGGASFGDLADAGNATQPTPTPAGITASPTAKFFTPRNDSTFCLGDATSLVCWGYSPQAGVTVPQFLADAGVLPPITDMSLGNCAVDSTHRLWCWCFNNSTGPQCGPAATGNGLSLVPVDSGAYGVSCGASATCIVDGQRHAECFGSGGSALGNGDTTNQNVLSPAPVVGPDGGGTLENVVRVSAGPNVGCALTQGACGATGPGAVYCWGNNAQGELGTDASANSYVPIPFPAP